MSESAPPPACSDSFNGWLADLPGRIGDVLVESAPNGGFTIRHRDDVGRDDLSTYSDAEAATDISLFTDAGEYRALKTAPNLRHGWLLVLADAGAVRRAIDLFYPARIAAFQAWRRGDLATTTFCETLARQTGMYRVAAKISDEQANDLIASVCRSDVGCLRSILWKRDATGMLPSTLLPRAKFDPAHDQTGRNEKALPLFCQEACNLLVAAARDVVKSER